MNRGIARRTMFERREEIEVFLEQLGAACIRGEIEVHAFCVLTTHYHLLVRSPRGELGVAMQRVQTEYSRWFNRRRRRDGALVRGRYGARTVDSLRYRRAVVAYIDRNPMAARLVDRADAYPFASARAYTRAGEGPEWLERSWVEACVCTELGLDTYDPARYGQVFGALPDSLARMVELRWSARSFEDPLDDLLAAAPAQVLDWMRRKARLADGIPPGVPVTDWSSVDEAVGAVANEHGSSPGIAGRKTWAVLRVGLARQLCGERLETIGERLDLSMSTVSSHCRLHKRLLQDDAPYAQLVEHAAALALRVWNLQKSD
jgi:hypothetical protein